MTNRELAAAAGVVALTAMLGAAWCEAALQHRAAAQAIQDLAHHQQEHAAAEARWADELRSLGADAVFRDIADALARAERDERSAVRLPTELARARQVFPSDGRGPALQARYVALRARRHARHEAGAATLAYLQAIGLP
jgi:hypothetical protein